MIGSALFGCVKIQETNRVLNDSWAGTLERSALKFLFTQVFPAARNSIAPLFMAAFIGLASTSVAAEAQIQRAPLNPSFVAYTDAIRAKGIVRANAELGKNYGYRPIPVDLTHLRQPIGAASLGSLSFAASYDLRTLGRVTSVKNQGAYGTCWAHASFGSMESCLLPGETCDFSENNMVNLHGFDWGYDDGGNAFLSMAYLTRWSGPVNESSDPYPNPGGSVSMSPVKHVQQVVLLPSKASATANDAIKQALMDYGAIHASYYHDDTYYNATYKSYYYNGSSNGNHAVTIVGWDDNYAKTKFNTAPAGNGAYIVKNSWGTGWGESGYYYVSYYDSVFAWGTCAVFNNAEPTNKYKTIYQYDPFGWVDSLGYGTPTVWGANIFTASTSERLGAVGFTCVDKDISYTVYVYTGVTAGAPRSGTLAATKSGTCPFAGFMTVPLDTTVPLTAGQRFSVVIRFTTTGYGYPYPYEYAYPNFCSAASASSGQSFYSSVGSTWTDLTTYDATANFCAKAYLTTDQTLPTVTINQAAGQADPTGTSPINFTVVFSEAVTNFASGDVTISGTASGTKTATVTGSGTTYNVAVTGMTGSGTVIATIAANIATDLSYNPNVASTSTDNTVTWSVDTLPPSVTINQALGQPDPTNSAPVNFMVVFSETVTGFATGDVTISGTAPGSKTATVTGSGGNYNVAVTGMTGSGTVIATIAAGVAQDTAGNNNLASTSTDNTVTYDNVAPSVTINQAAGQPDPTNNAPINFTVVFSETVTGFATGDVTISGTASGSKTATVTGSGTTYNVAVTGMTGSGTVIAAVGSGKAQDAAGNGNLSSTSSDFSVTYDITPPSLTINQAAGQPDPENSASAPIDFTVVFSETVTGFSTGDVTISGTAPGSKTATVTGGGTTYNVAVTGMTGDGTVVATVAINKAQDAASNYNLASTSTDNTVTLYRMTTVNPPAPYAWLDQYGLVSGGNYEAAAASDSDNDGLTAAKEYVAGTVPTNAASVFKSRVVKSGGQLRLQWTPDLTGAVPARVYSVYGKSGLASGFSVVSNNIPAGATVPLQSLTPNKFFKMGVAVP